MKSMSKAIRVSHHLDSRIYNYEAICQNYPTYSELFKMSDFLESVFKMLEIDYTLRYIDNDEQPIINFLINY
ncbi:hypothetical protein [Capybara microvirus Cap3_SP_332]|nr:hypothetical protein [Capybara microvirus Cap3_SP_332]